MNYLSDNIFQAGFVACKNIFPQNTCTNMFLDDLVICPLSTVNNPKLNYCFHALI